MTQIYIVASLSPSACPPAQTTILCTAALMRMDESFLLHEFSLHGFDETVVDRAMLWLQEQCDACPGLAEMREGLWKEAEELLEAWELRHIASIKASKVALSQSGTVRSRLERNRVHGAQRNPPVATRCAPSDSGAAVP